MQFGQSVYPHKYVRKLLVDGKWKYVYADTSAKTLADVTHGSTEKQLILAHGRPTTYFFDDQGFVTFGPPNVVGKKLFINTGKRGGYYAVARNPANPNEGVYLYDPAFLKKAASRKAADAIQAERAWERLDRDALGFLGSGQQKYRDLGLVIWLNNNTAMRIGAHVDASSVDPKERAAIINKARVEGWSDQAKQIALEQARKPTFGLMTLKMGDVSLNNDTSTATFRFLGKGGKENYYTAKLTPAIYNTLLTKKLHNRPEENMISPELNYKKVWRHYRKYGVHPHISRHLLAQNLLKQLIKDFRIRDDDTLNSASKRFENDLRERISDTLNHTKSVTEKAYLTGPYQRMLQEFREGIRSQLEAHRRRLHESYKAIPGVPITKALMDAVLWLELGAGNTVI